MKPRWRVRAPHTSRQPAGVPSPGKCQEAYGRRVSCESGSEGEENRSTTVVVASKSSAEAAISNQAIHTPWQGGRRTGKTADGCLPAVSISPLLSSHHGGLAPAIHSQHAHPVHSQPFVWTTFVRSAALSACNQTASSQIIFALQSGDEASSHIPKSSSASRVEMVRTSSISSPCTSSFL